MTPTQAVIAMVTAMRERDEAAAYATLEAHLTSLPRRARQRAFEDLFGIAVAHLVILLEGSEQANEAFAGQVLRAALRND